MGACYRRLVWYVGDRFEIVRHVDASQHSVITQNVLCFVITRLFYKNIYNTIEAANTLKLVSDILRRIHQKHLRFRSGLATNFILKEYSDFLENIKENIFAILL